MNIVNKRINGFVKLGEYLSKIDLDDVKYKDLLFCLNKTFENNKWFTIENLIYALNCWADQLNETNINLWLKKYSINNSISKKKVALILAGNIPIVGFHDLLCVLITGNIAVVKYSSSDPFLIPFLINKLIIFESTFKNSVEFSKERLSNFDMVIATGSNNSSRYFEYYFSKVPNLIRKNRSGVAVLNGNEFKKDLDLFAIDIVSYFGLGCRNISKVFLPIGYDLNLIFGALYKHSSLLDSNKYANNYDYNKAVFLMSQIEFSENGFFILKEDPSYFSPVSCLNYEYYEKLECVTKTILNDSDKIQCIVSNLDFPKSISLGTTQNPKLWEYADGKDTIDFILNS